MMINSEYITQLIQLSREVLQKNFKIEDFGFNDFELINFFLINNTLNQYSYSLSINIPKGDDKRDFYIPVLLSVSATLFFQNFIDDKTCYEVGEVVQKEGRRYKIIEKNKEGYIIASEDAEKTLKYPTNKQIKKYIVTTAELSNRQVKTKFNDYQNLFKLLFNEEYVPSKFTYKSAIILERKDFLEALKTEKIPDIDLRKAIPFKWVTKKGIAKDESDFIPVEPMIYLMPDYETFKDFVFEGIDNLDSVIFIGKNKYEPYITNIKKDLRNGEIQKVIFIGSKEIEVFNNLKKWIWTQTETNYFESTESGCISIESVRPEEFLQNIKHLEDRIQELDKEFCSNFKSLAKLKKYLHSLVLPSYVSRLTSQIEYVKHVYLKEINSLLYESFLEININPEPFINELSELSNKIFSTIPLSKFDKLTHTENIGVLIVPERFKETWEEELLNDAIGNFPKNIKIMTFRELKIKHDAIQTKKTICFLSLFGFKDFHYEIIRFIIQSPHNYLFILYPEEALVAESLLVKCQNEIVREYNSEDRYHLCKIRFPNQEVDENVSDIIQRFYAQDDIENKGYEYEQAENVEYELRYYNDTIENLEGSKSVLLEKGNSRRKAKVSDLIVGDRIRVYENASKERLFEIAVESDDKGILSDIVKSSKLWKQCLIDYYKKKLTPSYSETELLMELQRNGAKIQLFTMKKWLNINDKDLFPSQTLNLIAIKATIDCPVLNENFMNVKRSKKLYRSIMIALGRDLSDEIMDYIISEKKIIGNILTRFSKDQIEKIIDASAPLEIVKSIKIIESTENE
jgi:hypothetical protein